MIAFYFLMLSKGRITSQISQSLWEQEQLNRRINLSGVCFKVQLVGSRSFKGADGKFTLKCFACSSLRDHPEGFVRSPELRGTEQFSQAEVNAVICTGKRSCNLEIPGINSISGFREFYPNQGTFHTFAAPCKAKPAASPVPHPHGHVWDKWILEKCSKSPSMCSLPKQETTCVEEVSGFRSGISGTLSFPSQLLGEEGCSLLSPRHTSDDLLCPPSCRE